MTQAHTLPTARDGDLRAETPPGGSSMETAPRHKGPILTWCDHEAGPWDAAPGRLTLYAAHAEGLSHAPTGFHIVEWGGSWDDSSYEDPQGGFLPDWWFVAGSEFEVAANPVKWWPLPFGYSPAQDPVPALGLPAGEVEGLRAALEWIRDSCPATCDMTIAHDMAERARLALVLAPPASAADGEGLAEPIRMKLAEPCFAAFSEAARGNLTEPGYLLAFKGRPTGTTSIWVRLASGREIIVGEDEWVPAGDAPTPGERPGEDAVEALCDRLDRLNTVTDPQACAEAMDEARTVLLSHQTPAPAGAAVEAMAEAMHGKLNGEGWTGEDEHLREVYRDAARAALAAIAQGPGAGQAGKDRQGSREEFDTLADRVMARGMSGLVNADWPLLVIALEEAVEARSVASTVGAIHA